MYVIKVIYQQLHDVLFLEDYLSFLLLESWKFQSKIKWSCTSLSMSECAWIPKTKLFVGSLFYNLRIWSMIWDPQYWYLALHRSIAQVLDSWTLKPIQIVSPQRNHQEEHPFVFGLFCKAYNKLSFQWNYAYFQAWHRCFCHLESSHKHELIHHDLLRLRMSQTA